MTNTNTKTEATMEKKITKFSDSKLVKELAFARGFATAPPVSDEERDWLAALETEAKRRNH